MMQQTTITATVTPAIRAELDAELIPAERPATVDVGDAEGVMVGRGVGIVVGK